MTNKDYLCGVGVFRPSWLQRFASSRCYALVFACLGILQSSFRSYLVGTLSTIEKRFSLSSKQSSIIMIGDDISPVIGSIVIILFMRDCSKPRYIGLAMLASGFACAFAMFPFLLYGTSTHLGAIDATSPNMTFSAAGSRVEFCGAELDDPKCHTQHDDGSMSIIPLWSLFLANFLNGAGGTGYYVLGTAYLDDNVKKKHTSLYLGSLYFVRMLGPALGFSLSSRFLRFQENLSPSVEGGLTPKDPNWIGAWWVGYIIIGAGLLLMAFPTLMFPKKIRQKSEANMRSHEKIQSVKAELKSALLVIGRVLRIPTYTFRLLGFISSYIALAGYFITFPKYLEHQFQTTAAQASAITGPVYILSNALGILIGAIFMHFVKPPPRIVAIHCLLANFIATLGFYFLSSVSCDVPRTLPGNDCACPCTFSVSTPICDLASGTQYFSPCAAGCPPQNTSTKLYTECGCEDQTLDIATGRCPVNCENSLLVYGIAIFSIQMALSTTYVGGNLLSLRAVMPEDKSTSLAFTSTCLNLFAFIPYPIIYSFITDSACEIWESKCGSTGACWIYDLLKMRQGLHLVSASLLFICTCFQIVVVWDSVNIRNFYEDPADAEKEHEDSKHGDESESAKSPIGAGPPRNALDNDIATEEAQELISSKARDDGARS
ncbi:solute carrier organic anion transporter family member 2A1 [Galendromus occidentalis]|uniref:Solute carrier organic anion transporter family member 2A1 n=1 Tax=Galendromus occidentalis TaxID=34638 RepID=A0AAJ6QMX8_9ACAR|nr:solute carrier organic anion transporter family member 2A1 [Galendromus occidentalis]